MERLEAVPGTTFQGAPWDPRSPAFSVLSRPTRGHLLEESRRQPGDTGAAGTYTPRTRCEAATSSRCWTVAGEAGLFSLYNRPISAPDKSGNHVSKSDGGIITLHVTSGKYRKLGCDETLYFTNIDTDIDMTSMTSLKYDASRYFMESYTFSLRYEEL